MGGKDFEDRLMDALEEWVGENGVPMLRKQSWGVRRGTFQMNQEVDIMVDSGNQDYYIGLEAKTRDFGKSKAGMYFSTAYEPDQFKKQITYAEMSGRDVLVAIEARNHGECAEEVDCEGDCVFLVPLELFDVKYERGDKKVTWSEISRFGIHIGDEDDIEFTREAIDMALAVGDGLREDPDIFNKELKNLEGEDVNEETLERVLLSEDPHHVTAGGGG